MYRLCCAAILGGLLLAARPALAQEGAKDDVKKLEGDLAKLRVQLNDLESRLQKAKEAATAKQAAKTPAAHWMHHGYAWMHFARMHGQMGSCQKAQTKTAAEQKGILWQWTSWTRSGWHWSHWAGHHHFAAHEFGHHGRHGLDQSSTASLERRLEHIMNELAALRRDLSKTK